MRTYMLDNNNSAGGENSSPFLSCWSIIGLESEEPAKQGETALLRTTFVLLLYFLLHPIYYPRVLALPPSNCSDPGSHSRPSFPLPTTVRAFILS